MQALKQFIVVKYSTNHTHTHMHMQRLHNRCAIVIENYMSPFFMSASLFWFARFASLFEMKLSNHQNRRNQPFKFSKW